MNLKRNLYILGWTVEKLFTTPLVAVFCTFVEGVEIFISVFEDEYWRWKDGITEIKHYCGEKKND